MSNAIGELLGELLSGNDIIKDSQSKEKIKALAEKVTDSNADNLEKPSESYSKIDKKIEILTALCPVLGDAFTEKAEKLIKALKAIKIISELDKNN